MTALLEAPIQSRHLKYSVDWWADTNPCGLRRSALYDQIKAGRLRAVKIGRTTRIMPADMQAFLDGLPSWGTTGAGATPTDADGENSSLT